MFAQIIYYSGHYNPKFTKRNQLDRVLKDGRTEEALWMKSEASSSGRKNPAASNLFMTTQNLAKEMKKAPVGLVKSLFLFDTKTLV